MKRLVLAILLCACAFAQSPVNVSQGPPPAPFVKVFCDATSCTSAYTTLKYICETRQPGVTTTWRKSTTTLTSITDSSSTGTVETSAAHGLWIGARVTVSGVSTAGGTALNTSFVVQTVPSATTFTITTSGVTDATYTDAAMVLSTNSPLLTSSVWAIQVFGYSGTTLMSSYWANDSIGQGLACSSRTSY